MRLRVLDVGCGSRPRGDVNVDLRSPKYAAPRHFTLHPKKIRNFVLADVQHLPFQDETFHLVFSSHVIEHVENPVLMLKEIIRVAKDLAIIKCPHRCNREQSKYHRNFFNVQWFDRILSQLKGVCPIYYEIHTAQRKYPHHLIPILNLPWELKVEIYK